MRLPQRKLFPHEVCELPFSGDEIVVGKIWLRPECHGKYADSRRKKHLVMVVKLGLEIVGIMFVFRGCPEVSDIHIHVLPHN